MVWPGAVKVKTPLMASGYFSVPGELEPACDRQGEFKWTRGLGLCSVNKYLAKAACGLSTCGHPGDADVRHLASMSGALPTCPTVLSTGSSEQVSLLRGGYQPEWAVGGGGGDS